MDRETIRKEVEKAWHEFSDNKIDKITDRLYENLKGVELEKDPYLQNGWPCESDYNDNSSIKWVGYYKDGKIYTDTEYSDLEGSILRYYKPIGTEWDFAPDWSDCVEITNSGEVIFCEKNGADLWHTHIKTVLPPEYYGKKINRPEWAK